MALVNCKECSKEISELAVTCPNCGIATLGISDEKIEIKVKRTGYLQQRWVAGIAFWPGLLLILIPALTGAGKEEFVSAWGISKWLMGFGFAWYVLSEIEQNLYEKKLSKK